MKEAFDNVENKQAISILEAFFEYHGLDYALQDMDQMIYYAVHRKYYKGRPPYTMVFFAEELRKLLPACLLLEKEYWLQYAFEVAPGEKGLPNLDRREDFMPDHATQEWNYMPGHLSIEQYLNPIKAFTQCRKYKTKEDWMRCIDELLEYSLSRATITECYPPYNVLKLRRILLQLVEAAYLVFIRYRHSLASPAQPAAPTEEIDNENNNA